MKEVLIQSVPLSDIVISHVSEHYASSMKRYLESLGCRVTYWGERGKYHIQFPEGTTENTYAGQSTRRTHRTIVTLPGGTRLIKFVLVPLNDTYPVYCTLVLPNEVLFGPNKQTTRVEIINQQAKTAIVSGDMEQGSAYVQAGVTGAKTLGSQRRYNEAYDNFKQMALLWPQEKRVKELRELFVERL